MSTSANRLQVQSWRVFVFYAVIIFALGALLFRMVSLQVFQGSQWVAQAVDNYTSEISDAAPRGIITDRNGYILARNTASYNVEITPANLPDDDADIQRIYREVSELIDVPVNFGDIEFAKKFSACIPGPGIAQMVALGDSIAPYTPVPIKCNISDELAKVIREKAVDWPGVTVAVDPIREYPTGSLTADIIGFLGPIPASLEADYRANGYIPNRDKIGYAGVETSLDDVLIGKNGKRVVQVDVAGKILRNLEAPRLPQPGYNVQLTIDTRLQKVAEASLLEEINYWNTFFGRLRISSGAVIAINPKTGEILAMVSYPTYENNRLARIIPAYYYEQLSEDPRHPLLNIAISGEFPPGSAFKLSTATGAYNEGVVGPDKLISTPGKLTLCERFSPNEPCTDRNSRPFVDWIYEQNGVINEEGFGALDFFHCIAYSSNVCFYKLGGGFGDEIKEGLGIFRLGEYARALGYDRKSGIELPGEAKGLIPSPTWKRINTGENWSTGDTYIASVGQGYVLATPLQVLMSGATIANHGRLMQPTVVRSITDVDGRVRQIWFKPDDFSLYEYRSVAKGEEKPENLWVNLADPSKTFDHAPEGSYQISPFTPNMKWDITKDQVIAEYSCEFGYCDKTGALKIVQPSTVDAVRTGTRLAVTDARGTLHKAFQGFPIAVAGKTGTAEYCDNVAQQANRCRFGSWPTHSWTMAYAPFDDPEIAIIAFEYNGGEGASVAAPVVARVMQAYFELKAIDLAAQGGG